VDFESGWWNPRFGWAQVVQQAFFTHTPTMTFTVSWRDERTSSSSSGRIARTWLFTTKYDLGYFLTISWGVIVLFILFNYSETVVLPPKGSIDAALIQAHARGGGYRGAHCQSYNEWGLQRGTWENGSLERLYEKWVIRPKEEKEEDHSRCMEIILSPRSCRGMSAGGLYPMLTVICLRPRMCAQWFGN